MTMETKVIKYCNLYQKKGQAGNVFSILGCAPCIPGFGGGGGGKELKVIVYVRNNK